MRWLAVENRLPRIDRLTYLICRGSPAGCFVFRIQSTVRSRSQYSAPGQQKGQGSGWGWLRGRVGNPITLEKRCLGLLTVQPRTRPSANRLILNM